VAISGFEWDDDNVVHIGWHDFSPEEVEEVLSAITRCGERARNDIPHSEKLSTADWPLSYFTGCAAVLYAWSRPEIW